MGLFRRKPTPLTWSVVVAAPKGPDGDMWGDTWFARDLVDALQRAGQQAKVVHRGGAESNARLEDDVVIVLRGLRRVHPVRPSDDGRGPTWVLWVISHPELVEADEPGEYDLAFAASEHWSRAAEFGIAVRPLLQATNTHRFRPGAGTPDSGADVLFAGSTRGEYRSVVRACVEAAVPLTLYGVGWEEFVSPELIAGEFLPNEDLPRAYASAGVVLNDHWSDMAAEGFLSNRLFDAVATGARVVSDDATGLHDVFGESVQTYASAAEIPELIASRESFGSFEDRCSRAKRIAQDHSFDARAAVLIDQVRAARGRA